MPRGYYNLTGLPYKLKYGFKKGHVPTYVKIQSEHCGWKGDEVGYDALHDWVQKYGSLKYGNKINVCEHCGETKIGKYKMDWASKEHKYIRDLSEWLRLCRKCHAKYDKSFKN